MHGMKEDAKAEGKEHGVVRTPPSMVT